LAVLARLYRPKPVAVIGWLGFFRGDQLATGTKVINSGSWISWLYQGITDAWRERSGTACALTSSKRIAWCEIRRALCLEPRLTDFAKMAEEDTSLP
ncbi:hypothetical protein KWH44_20810, partial [Xanthomonas campestris pv. veroniae]|nr:hypothetical protein [Xanthomonas campestris pv. veroniae]